MSLERRVALVRELERQLNPAREILALQAATGCGLALLAGVEHGEPDQQQLHVETREHLAERRSIPLRADALDDAEGANSQTKLIAHRDTMAPRAEIERRDAT